MRRVAATLLVAAGLAGCASTPRPPAGAALPGAALQSPERFVVVTVRNAGPTIGLRGASTVRGYDSVAPYTATGGARAAAQDLAKAYGLQPAASWPIALLGVNCIVYQLPDAADRATLLAKLAKDRRVESAQALSSFSTQSSTYNDPYAGLQQSLGQMDVAQAQQWSRGEGVRVAIVDTGVDADHPDLRGRVALQRNFVDADAQQFLSDPHGTAVAGVIAAVANNGIGIAGVAPAVTLLAFKACWRAADPANSAVCNSFTLAQALAAAVTARADVINLSLAGPPDPLLARIVQQALRLGIVVVGATPASGARAGFPGDVDGVITVDTAGLRDGGAALTAPGRDVLTLVPGAHYDFVSGSSLAAAQVTGVVALLRARDRALTGSEALHLLARTSQRFSTAAGSVSSINACAALVALQRHGSCDPPSTASPTVQTAGSESVDAH